MTRILEWIARVALGAVRLVLRPFVWVEACACSAWTALDRRRALRVALPKGTLVRITCPRCSGAPDGITQRRFAGDWEIDYYNYDPGDYHLVRPTEYVHMQADVTKSTYAGPGCIEVIRKKANV